MISERASGTSKYYHGDQLGSTRGITSSTQAITDSREYDSFGLTIATTGTTATPFGFVGEQGYRSDSQSGLQLLGARYYDASIGRFISRDPSGYGGGDPNLYRYAANNPVNATDPTGLLSNYGAVGAVAGIVLATFLLGISSPFIIPAIVVGAGASAALFVYLETGNGGAAASEGIEAASYTLDIAMLGSLLLGGRCFPEGTPIRMADGSRQRIERVEAGDSVLTRDEHTGEQSYGKVAQTFVRTSDTLLTIKTEDGNQIEATPEHPFWVEGRGFVAAKRLARSDLLVDAECQAVAITGIRERKGKFRVYNFEVEKTHTYYAGNGGWWVHNACGGAKGYEIIEGVRRGKAAQEIGKPTIPGPYQGS